MINQLNMFHGVTLVLYFFLVPSAEGLGYDGKRSTHPAYKPSEAASQVGSLKSNRYISEQAGGLKSVPHVLSKKDVPGQPVDVKSAPRVLSEKDITGQPVDVESPSHVLYKRDNRQQSVDVKSDQPIPLRAQNPKFHNNIDKKDPHNMHVKKQDQRLVEYFLLSTIDLHFNIHSDPFLFLFS